MTKSNQVSIEREPRDWVSEASSSLSAEDVERVFSVIIGDGLTQGERVLLELRLFTEGWTNFGRQVIAAIYADMDFAMTWERYHRADSESRQDFDTKLLRLAGNYVDQFNQ